MAYDQQVMRNKQICHTKLFLQVFKHIDHLRLNGYIKRRYRLITDDKLRIHSKCTGNTDTLTLSAGELMRITGRMLCVQSDQLHQIQDFLTALCFGCVKLMYIQRLSDDIFDCHTWIQGRVRILKHHLHLLAQRSDIFIRYFFSVKKYLTTGRFI